MEEIQNNTKAKPTPANAGARVYHFLGLSGFFSKRKNEAEFEAWLQGLTFLEFEKWLYWLNRHIRGLAPNYLVQHNGQSIIRGKEKEITYVSSRGHNKDMLMRELFGACKRLSDLIDRGLLAWYGLGFVHRVKDGNGRIGRLLYLMLSGEACALSEEELSLILDHGEAADEDVGAGQAVFYKRFLNFTGVRYFLNRTLLPDFMGEEFAGKYGAISCKTSDMLAKGLSPALSRRENDWLFSIMHEAGTPYWPVHGLVAARLLREKGELEIYGRESSLSPDERMVPEDGSKLMLAIDVPELLLHLTIEDVGRILAFHEELKILEIRTLIKIFEFPEKYGFEPRQAGRVSLSKLRKVINMANIKQ